MTPADSHATPIPRSLNLRRWLIAFVVLELLVLYVILRNESWVFDDNLFLVSARVHGFNLPWLLSLKYQHWGIVYNFLFTVLLHLFPLDYRWALILMLALLGGSALLLERIVSMLFGAPRAAVLVAAWFAASVVFVRSLEWFSSGAQILPTTFCDLLCLYGWLRYRADGSRAWLFVSWGALASGLLVYEKPAFMLLYLVLIRVLFMSADLRPRALMRAFLRERVQWGVYAAIVAVWFAAYLSRHPPLAAGTVSFHQYLSYFRIFWVNTLVPALGGVVFPGPTLAGIRGSGLNGLQTVLVLLGQVGVLIAVAVSLRRKSSAWRGWLFLAISVLLVGVLVARERIAQFGVEVGYDTRYLFEFAWLVPLAVCFAFSRQRTVQPSFPATSRAQPFRLSRPVTALVTAAVCASYLAVSVASAMNVADAWPGAMARTWQDHFASGLASAQRGNRRLIIANNTVPFWIIGYPFAPFNVLSELIPLYDRRVQVDGPLLGRLTTVDTDGHVVPAAVGPAIGNGSISALERPGAGSLPTGSGVVRRPGEVCIATGARAVRVERRLAPSPNPARPPYYLRLVYSTLDPLTVVVGVDTGSGYASGRAATMPLVHSATASISWLGTGAPRRLRVSVPPRSSLCIKSVDVVTIRSDVSQSPAAHQGF